VNALDSTHIFNPTNPDEAKYTTTAVLRQASLETIMNRTLLAMAVKPSFFGNWFLTMQLSA